MNSKKKNGNQLEPVTYKLSLDISKSTINGLSFVFMFLSFKKKKPTFYFKQTKKYKSKRVTVTL